MSSRAEVLLWAERVLARKAEPPHVLLDLPADATHEEAQDAFHAIARTAHPDLHRRAMTAAELELVTSAYAVVAGAYQTLRTQTMHTVRMRPLRPEEVAPPSDTAPAAGARPAGARAGTPSRPPPVAPPTAASTPATQTMSSRALIYYRKAEICLRRGDLRGALLQIKLAIAADPTSGFLRTALAEVELEVRKGT